MNSAGSAVKENGKAVESITGKINTFKSQFQELSQNLISSKFVKTIVDMGTALLKLANTDLGQLAIKLGVTATAIGLFNAGLDKLKKTSTSINLIGLLTYIKVLGTDATTSAFSVDLLTTSLIKMVGVKLVALAQNPLTWVVAGTAAVYGLAKAFNATNVSSKEYYDNAVKGYSESKQSLDDTTNQIEDLEAKIKELGSKSSVRTSTEEATLFQYEEQLRVLKVQQVELEKQTKERQKQLEIAAKEQAQKKITGFKGVTVDIEDTKGEITKGAYSGLLTTNKDKGAQTFGYRTETITNYKEALSLIKSINEEIKQGDLTEEERTKKTEQLGKLKKSLLDYENQYLEASKQENLSAEDKNEYLKKYIEIQKEVEPEKWAKSVLTDMFKDEDIVKATNDTRDFISVLRDMKTDGKLTTEEIENLKDQFPTFSKYLEDNGMSTEQAAYYLNKYYNEMQNVADQTRITSVDFEELSKSMETLLSNFDTLNDALLEQAEYGSISAETALDLIDKGYATALAFDEETGAITLNKEATMAMAKAKLAAEKVNLTTKIDETISSLESEKKMCMENANAWIARAKAMAAKGAASDKESDLAELSTRLEVINEIEKSIDTLGTKQYATSGISKRSSSKSGSSSSKSEKTWWEQELENIKDQYENNDITIEQYINSLENLLGRVQEGTDAWKKINKELQKQKLQKVEDDYKRGTISLKEYIKQLQNLQKAYKEGTDGWLNLADKIKKGLQDLLSDQKSAYDKAHSAANKIIEDEIDKINDQKEATSDYYDKLIEEKQKANDESERELELAKLQEALEKAKTERTKRVK